MSHPSCIILLDNGSLASEATLWLRQIARLLSERIGLEVVPVSARYADRIALDKLGGVRANVLESFLREQVGVGCRDFLVLPLFFGRSDALTKFVPSVFEKFSESEGGIRVEYAKPLVDLDDESDDGLASILVKSFLRKLDTRTCSEGCRVIVVDHGSPSACVAACRDLVTRQMNQLLGSRVLGVVGCSMERREGEAYDFNEPLLEAVLNGEGQYVEGALFLTYMFLFPGRHAGPGGDIEQICLNSRWVKAGGVLEMCSLVGESPDLLGLLETRFRQVYPTL